MTPWFSDTTREELALRPPDYELDIPEGVQLFTPELDVRLLIALSHIAPSGEILETGCNRGVTTRQLALWNPARNVFGFDVGQPTNDHQMVEACVGVVGDMCPLDNAHFYTSVEQLPNPRVAFAFIDGDHSFAGVMRDFNLCASLAVRGAIIAFHDYTATSRREHELAWIGVSRVVEVVSNRLGAPFTHVNGTSVAYLKMP